MTTQLTPLRSSSTAPATAELYTLSLHDALPILLLHIAAADVEHILTTMKVSDHLTYVAEALLDFVVQMAWNQMVERYGKPAHLTDNHKGLVVVAYGKLGGWELGYGSDLDLVFLHDCPANSVRSEERRVGKECRSWGGAYR